MGSQVHENCRKLDNWDKRIELIFFFGYVWMIDAGENSKELLLSRYLDHAKYSFPYLDLSNTL